MKTCTTCLNTKDFVDFHKDKTRKDGFRNLCKACVGLYMRQYHSDNSEKIIAKAAKWVQENRRRHNDKCNKWAKNNPGKVNAQTARRYAAKTRATPKWLDADQLWLLKEAYDLAKRREIALGFKWEVDHIVPLRGKTVSGLHVPWNIQVIPATTNRRKSNTSKVNP